MKHLAFALLLAVLIAACGDDDARDGDGEGGSGAGGDASSSTATGTGGSGASGGGAAQPCDSPGVYCDAEAGLMWQIQTEGQAGSKSAGEATCASLELAGFGDWRLPDISELRSLIRGCPQTEPGGACGVASSCVEYACLDSCSGCAFGDGFGAAGCYWPAELEDAGGICGGFWSANDVPDPIGGQPATWIVDFSFAKVTDEFQGLSGTRCVRAR